MYDDTEQSSERRRVEEIIEFMIFVQRLVPELVPLAKQQIDLIKGPDVLQSLAFKMFSGCTAC